MKVNLGCGVDVRDGYVNVDRMPLDGVDVVADLDDPERVFLPFDDDSVDEFLAVDFVEHVTYPLPLFEELWRCAKPGAVFNTALPYGTSDDAWEDPTHVRPYYIGSWRYFSQPIFYRADYQYTADWNVDEIVLDIPADISEGADANELRRMVSMFRNVVERQYVRMTAVKPARPRDPSLLAHPNVVFRRVGHG